MYTMSKWERIPKEITMLNRVVVVGRLTKDPELRKTNEDKSFATFSLAVDNTIKEKDGTRGTLFIDCRIFGNQAENLVKYTRKGSKIAVDGSINQRNFVRQDGTKGKAIEIYADSVTFLDPKPETDEEAEKPDIEDFTDDLPFEKEPAMSSCGSLDGEDIGDGEKLKAVPPQPLTPKGKK